MKEEIRYSPRELDKHFKGKEEVSKGFEEEEEFDFEERLEENDRLYTREWMREDRKNKKKEKPVNNKEAKKEIAPPPKSAKPKSPRYTYHRNYHRKKTYGIEEPKIKDITTLFSDIKKYGVDFPSEEFNKKLDEILKSNNLPVKERRLKDILMWDILDKKGLLSPERIVGILNYNSIWEKPIEDIMHKREYVCMEKDGERIYIPLIPQTAQK